MGKPNFSALLPDVTLQQIEDLKPMFSGNKTQIIMRAVAELHKREMSKLKRARSAESASNGKETTE